MIRVKTLQIEDFRGIRELNLDLAGDSFGICGPNGTGKSGVVDAIEFALTGDITRLSGQGTAGLSVKNHAPHVDQRTHPEKAHVTITADIPFLGKTVTIHRSVKNPKKVTIDPTEQNVTDVVAELAIHPEFALSRREIVKYIITPPGQRSIDVQTLLRLDHIESLRKSLTTLSNACLKEVEECERSRARAQQDLRSALKIDKLDSALVLQKVNEKRKTLDLPHLTELTKDTSFKAGIVALKGVSKKPAVSKAVAQADLTELQTALEAGEPGAVADSRQATKDNLEQLLEDEQALALAHRYGFIKTGLDLVTEDACPLCDTSWQADDLRQHLRQKILGADKIKSLLDRVRTSINVNLGALTSRLQAVERVIHYSQSLEPSVPTEETQSYLHRLKNTETALREFLEDHTRITPAISAVRKSWWSPAGKQMDQIKQCHAAVNSLPDMSGAEEARDFLSIAQDRYERLLQTKRMARQRTERRAVAQKVLDHYNATAVAVLEGIYNEVAKDFSNFYRAINSEDEDKFVGKLCSEPAKLSFDVDFYGRGLFPPGAYHSEGHQDAMGLCLYLALMKHTLGDKFTFAVLDDVLMSVDTGHRREVCRLLKKEFPDTQFILTTHDRVWLKYMEAEGLISRSQSFSGWTVDSGPRVWDDYDIWSEIQGALAVDGVAQAAWLLRRYLEFTSFILADDLRARIEFRGDGRYDLSDLMPNVLKRWCQWLENGEKSATKWKLGDVKTAIAALRVEAKELIKKTNAEQWAINPSVHFNEWADLKAHEFQEVVDAFRALLDHLRCHNPACMSYLHISPRKSQAEELRCNCGTISINLRM